MNTPKIKLDAGFFFGQKAHFNKWLKELTGGEQDLVIDMLVEFSQEKEAQNARLLQALKEIENPIYYMRLRLQEDERLDGAQALAMANSSLYIRKIARAAIAEAESTTPTP